MIGTLSTSLGGTSLGLLNDTRPSPLNSTGKVSFRRHKACNALIHAVTDSVESSLYEVLRVNRNASPIEIKTAYRNLAKLYHPDASDLKQHHEPNFIEIHNAYATLYDPAERAMYDRKLNIGLGRGSTAGGMRRGVNTTRRWETDQCW
ncbi:chaperone protein dnaJ 11, chloroplastic-like [Cynara cardunculus var. scolymus]|nr:chaperone protein dnaJ 11, chloroplastic-like [Cynara cardunculus var. scolymus]